MLKEFFTAALGMLNQQTRLEVTANNMANANTAGFKRQGVFERNLIDARANFYNVKGDAEQNDPPIGSYTVFEAGNYQQTDNPLDLAIQGEGFFVLKDLEGKDYLTRAGNFTINTEGEIIAKDGKKLQGYGGDLVIPKEFLVSKEGTTDFKSVEIKITENGHVFANNKDIGTIIIAKPQDNNTIQRISNQHFIAKWMADVEPVDPDKVVIKQGWIEGSNVNVVKEMVELIELQRMFEAGSKVIATNDSTLDKSIALGRYQ
jgi:flagellar basal-body rod protein FlgG